MKKITIQKPSDIKSKWFYESLEEMINNGHKKISLEMAFVTDNVDLLMNEFRLIKNDICFKRDIRNGKFTKTTQ